MDMRNRPGTHHYSNEMHRSNSLLQINTAHHHKCTTHPPGTTSHRQTIPNHSFVPSRFRTQRLYNQTPALPSVPIQNSKVDAPFPVKITGDLLMLVKFAAQLLIRVLLITHQSPL